MTVEKELLAFLARPENLPTALEVARHVSNLRRRFHALFWRAYAKELKKRLEESERHRSTWYVTKSDKNHSSSWVKCRLRPQLALEHPKLNLLNVTFEQNTSSSNYSLYYGIQWTDKEGHAVNLPEYEALRTALVERGNELKENKWWVIIVSTGYKAQQEKFMLRMAQERETFIGELVDLQWTLFLDTVDYLNAFNEAVVRQSRAMLTETEV